MSTTKLGKRMSVEDKMRKAAEEAAEEARKMQAAAEAAEAAASEGASEEAADSEAAEDADDSDSDMDSEDMDDAADAEASDEEAAEEAAEEARKMQAAAEAAKAEPPPKAKRTKRTGAVTNDAILDAARTLTGKSDPGAVVGALHALAESREVVKRLSDKVADLEGRLAEEQIRKIVKLGIRQGKIPPARKEKALALAREIGVKRFREHYLAALPRLVNTDKGSREAAPSDEKALTDTDRMLARTLGIKVEDLAKAKAGGGTKLGAMTPEGKTN